MKKLLAFSSLTLLAPMFVFAQTTDLDPIKEIFTSIQGIINILIPIAVALAVLFFFWGLGQYILAAEDEKAHAAGRSKMIWGVVALFVIVSIWGIVGWIGGIFGIGQGGSAPVPGVSKEAGTPVTDDPSIIEPK